MSKRASTTSKPIRVLQVVTVMNRAGLETMLMNYYRAIDRKKVQFDFLVHRSESGDYDDEIRTLGGRIYRFPPNTPHTMLTYESRFRKFLKSHPEYTIVHSHLDALSSLPLLAAKRHGIPVRIAHSHNNDVPHDITRPLRMILKKGISHHATNLFACSNEAGVFMFGQRSEFEIINNAIDVDSFKFSKATRKQVRNTLNLSTSDFVIGNIGRFANQKNHSFLIDIFRELVLLYPRSILLLAGTGENESRVKTKVAELGLQEKVYFLGVRSDIPDLLQAMDVFVMPSLHEGLPVVSIEAQASGLACVFASTITRELDVAKNCTFIALETSAKEWALSILEARKRSRTDATALVAHSGYSITIEAKKMEAFYVANSK